MNERKKFFFSSSFVDFSRFLLKFGEKETNLEWREKKSFVIFIFYVSDLENSGNFFLFYI